ncbi:MAG: hypothetical protein A4S09_10580 [Proteobacteria bacterium SG_bin7]|nr:MAG: hypothetical protein A4S09_10580 [Proteobacteria bacterium SG_bin7]
MNMKLREDKGMATIETIPLLVVFVIFVGYGIGAFGIIHTGILNSIASRTYAFETFRHRPQLKYFRDEGADNAPRGQFYKGGTRLHGIQSETAGNDQSFIYATERGIARGLASNDSLIERSRQPEVHINVDREFSGEGFTGRTREGVSIAWIKVFYGICLDAGCGDEKN